MKTKKILLTLIALLAFSLQGVAGETAADLLSRAASKYKSAKSISASFTIRQGNTASRGTMIISADKFKISTADMTTWFDGKTQWTYVPSAKEVNITTPTADELQQVNPFAVVNRFDKQYNVAFDGAAVGKTRRLRLTSKTPKSDISTVIVTLDTSTLFPTQIKVIDRRRQVTEILVTKTAVGGALPEATFRFDKKAYPGVEVVDLR